MANDEYAQKPDQGASEAVRELLGGLPSPAIPPDVSERILASIAAESRSRSAEQESNVSALPRSSKFRWVLPVAGTAAAMAFLGMLVWPIGGDGDNTETLVAGSGCVVSADSAADMTPVLHASGVAYTKVSLASQAESMARRTTAACSQAAPDGSESLAQADGGSPDAVGSPNDDPASGSAAFPNDPQNSEKPQRSMSVPTPGQASPGEGPAPAVVPERLRSEQTVRKCVVSAVGGRVVHAVDVATFDGQPAVVVVVASPHEVLALSCGSGPVKVLAQRAMVGRP